MSQWWKDFYNEEFADILLEREQSEEKKSADFIIKHLDLKKGDRIYDQCCGTGSLSLALANEGLDVIGVDQCVEYINRAKTKKSIKGSMTFFADDAFKYRTEKSVDGAVCWYTSFGYTKSDKQNKEMIQRAYDSLKTGGKFALDFTNVTNVLYSRQNVKVINHYGEKKYKLIREYGLDLLEGMFDQKWTYITEDGNVVSKKGGVKMYMPYQIVELMTECGFKNIVGYGSIEDEPLTQDSARCILIGERA